MSQTQREKLRRASHKKRRVFTTKSEHALVQIRPRDRAAADYLKRVGVQVPKAVSGERPESEARRVAVYKRRLAQAHGHEDEYGELMKLYWSVPAGTTRWFIGRAPLVYPVTQVNGGTFFVVHPMNGRGAYEKQQRVLPKVHDLEAKMEVVKETALKNGLSPDGVTKQVVRLVNGKIRKTQRKRGQSQKYVFTGTVEMLTRAMDKCFPALYRPGSKDIVDVFNPPKGCELGEYCAKHGIKYSRRPKKHWLSFDEAVGKPIEMVRSRGVTGNESHRGLKVALRLTGKEPEANRVCGSSRARKIAMLLSGVNICNPGPKTGAGRGKGSHHANGASGKAHKGSPSWKKSAQTRQQRDAQVMREEREKMADADAAGTLANLEAAIDQVADIDPTAAEKLKKLAVNAAKTDADSQEASSHKRLFSGKPPTRSVKAVATPEAKKEMKNIAVNLGPLEYLLVRKGDEFDLLPNGTVPSKKGYTLYQFVSNGRVFAVEDLRPLGKDTSVDRRFHAVRFAVRIGPSFHTEVDVPYETYHCLAPRAVSTSFMSQLALVKNHLAVKATANLSPLQAGDMLLVRLALAAMLFSSASGNGHHRNPDLGSYLHAYATDCPVARGVYHTGYRAPDSTMKDPSGHLVDQDGVKCDERVTVQFTGRPAREMICRMSPLQLKLHVGFPDRSEHSLVRGIVKRLGLAPLTRKPYMVERMAAAVDRVVQYAKEHAPKEMMRDEEVLAEALKREKEKGLSSDFSDGARAYLNGQWPDQTELLTYNTFVKGELYANDKPKAPRFIQAPSEFVRGWTFALEVRASHAYMRAFEPFIIKGLTPEQQREKIAERFKDCEHTAATDFTAMEKNYKPEDLYSIFRVMAALDPDRSDDLLRYGRIISTQRAVLVSKNVVVGIPPMMNSGAQHTSVGNAIFNLLCMLTLSGDAEGILGGKRALMVEGDDGLISVDGIEERFSEDACEDLGVRIKLERNEEGCRSFIKQTLYHGERLVDIFGVIAKLNWLLDPPADTTRRDKELFLSKCICALYLYRGVPVLDPILRRVLRGNTLDTSSRYLAEMAAHVKGHYGEVEDQTGVDILVSNALEDEPIPESEYVHYAEAMGTTAFHLHEMEEKAEVVEESFEDVNGFDIPAMTDMYWLPGGRETYSTRAVEPVIYTSGRPITKRGDFTCNIPAYHKWWCPREYRYYLKGRKELLRSEWYFLRYLRVLLALVPILLVWFFFCGPNVVSLADGPDNTYSSLRPVHGSSESQGAQYYESFTLTTQTARSFYYENYNNSWYVEGFDRGKCDNPEPCVLWQPPTAPKMLTAVGNDVQPYWCIDMPWYPHAGVDTTPAFQGQEESSHYSMGSDVLSAVWLSVVGSHPPLMKAAELLGVWLGAVRHL